MQRVIKIFEQMRERTERQINAFESGHVKISATSSGVQDETEHFLNFLRKQVNEIESAIEIARDMQKNR